MTSVPPSTQRRAGLDLFLVSLLLLFLELACIRWFPAHVLFLTFFTNVVLLACFLGMSLGCLAARRPTDWLSRTPLLLAVTLGLGLVVEFLRSKLPVGVGNQAAPQFVFFGTETPAGESVNKFFVPIEVLGGVFFAPLALVLVGPGQELGRAFARIPNRVGAYTLNVLGSLVGIGLFALCSWAELPPIAWFGPIALLLIYFLVGRGSGYATGVWLALALLFASVTTGPILLRKSEGRYIWSPYYRIDFDRDTKDGNKLLITVNQVGHQQMQSRDRPFPAYALPHLLHRDSGRPAFQNVLVIGAGSGNDVSRALQWGAEHVDAVEIDPAIQRLGAEYHPDHPYQDPRVTVHLDDGRNFLRSAEPQKYDLILYALVDSLVLHSSYSNLRLESYLFTREALADVHRCLKPDGWFVMSNFFRQGWIVARLQGALASEFATPPVVMTLPYRAVVEPEEKFSGFTVFVAGTAAALDPLRDKFKAEGAYWINILTPLAPGETANGFVVHPPVDIPEPKNPVEAVGQEVGSRVEPWHRFGPAKVEQPTEQLRIPDDDWPFLYLREPMIPDVSWRAVAVMGGLSLVLLFLFRPPPEPVASGGWGEAGRMFFLGAGFMLIETKAVVHMALLFGSTWMVNTVVFAAVLGMILVANLYVSLVKPKRLEVYYVLLFAALAANFLIPLDWFLGMGRTAQLIGASALVFAPMAFAGVIFPVSFARSSRPDRAFGANVAGALAGGLAENCSLLTGFKYLVVVAAAFYLLSALARTGAGEKTEPVGTK